ncbi:MAG: hypothetical protein R2731_00470 [Nocardioides sp.]
MSPRVVYLHVGAPKTGTTYLQDRLTLNEDTLAGHGVHFPRAPGWCRRTASTSGRRSTCSTRTGAGRPATRTARGTH